MRAPHADPPFALVRREQAFGVDLALKAGVKRRAGGLGLVLAGHRAGPAGVGRDLGAQATLLLVLDTCEYLLGACATLAGAMQRGAAG
jgi:hypothetical protein